ncbi:hypothetical protein [Nocardia salmonicida]|uniref:hypothetical protein n=1 Tax=Nocardia salmonicida TaxID=53431 RepID=UPI0013F4BFA2|nr:hypothetical protein [Nocardia salmonicida]
MTDDPAEIGWPITNGSLALGHQPEISGGGGRVGDGGNGWAVPAVQATSRPGLGCTRQ